jgi:hypothetical protein
MITRDDVDIGAFLSRSTALSTSPSTRVVWASTDEGFEDAAASFPRRALCQ